MKFFTSIVAAALLAAQASLAAAMPASETNAQRMARGLPPMRPRNMYAPSPVEMAKRGNPSGQPGQCNGGEVKCCNSVTNSSDPVASLLAGLLGIVLPANVGIGLTCSSLNVIGVGGNSCSTQTACCSGNSYNGLINVGCSPIHLG